MGDDKQLVDEDMMETMSVAPPNEDAGAGTTGERPDGPAAAKSGVADEDPLSAHPS
jgi:hypothetical protein